MLPDRTFVALAFCVGCMFASVRGADEPDIDISSQVRDKYLVILCAERDFDSVKREAEIVSKASGVQFSMGGNIWDRQRGLILPDDCDDPMYCGQYVARRYNELNLGATNPVGYISVEKSDGYPNLRKGYYIALAAICNSQEEARSELMKFTGFAPQAYIAKTEIYMGCIH
ncbi:MAG: hypothetical protein ACM3KL_04020 [Alphaproteobacteria bacterium]|jgi:hypothetical protein